MISAAFYAPMKGPGHPVPSGDRAMARAVLKALSAVGVEVELASTFQTRDGAGSSARQAMLIKAADAETARLTAHGKAAGWRMWVSYHNYYKAPDLLGPKVAAALGIPYVLIEATRARKRLGGPWDAFARLAEDATDRADVVFYLTQRDGVALKAYAPQGQSLIHLPPFLPSATLPTETNRSVDVLAVGMFRAGDKVASYRLIADTLARIKRPDWHLEIAGDGPERETIEEMMHPFGPHVTMLGALNKTQMTAAYARTRILFWPGVNEAYGMAYLEAQAAGVTVVAQDRPGVRDVLYPAAAYPAPALGAAALAGRLEMLLAMPKLAGHLGARARQHVANHHLLSSAEHTLRHTLRKMLT